MGGLRLSPEEWDTICNLAGKVDASRSAGQINEDIDFKAGEDVKLVLRPNTSGSICIDVRRFYTDKTDGEKKPTKKGIFLSPGDWADLKEAFKSINAAIESFAEDSQGPAMASLKRKSRTAVAEKSTPV